MPPMSPAGMMVGGSRRLAVRFFVMAGMGGKRSLPLRLNDGISLASQHILRFQLLG